MSKEKGKNYMRNLKKRQKIHRLHSDGFSIASMYCAIFAI